MMRRKVNPPKVDVEPFDLAAQDDVEAHGVVRTFIDTAGKAGFIHPWPSLDERPGGARLTEEDADWNRRCVIALAEQEAHWQAQAERIRQASPDRRDDPLAFAMRGHAEWDIINYRRVATCQALTELLKRKLPLSADDVASLAEVSAKHAGTEHHGVPPLGVVKQAEQWAKRDGAVTPRLAEALRTLAASLRTSNRKPQPKQAAKLEALLGDVSQGLVRIVGNPPPAALLSLDGVLVPLQVEMRLRPADDVASEPVGPDRFPLRADSQLREEHAALSEVLAAFLDVYRWMERTRRAVFDAGRYPNAAETSEFESRKEKALRRLMSLPALERARHYLAACERELALRTPSGDLDGEVAADLAQSASEVRKKLRQPEESNDRGVDFARMFFRSCVLDYHGIEGWMLSAAERYAGESPLTAGEQHVLHRLRCDAVDRPPFGDMNQDAARLTRLIDDNATLLLAPGEYWSDQVHGDLAIMPGAKRGDWTQLLKHALTATASKPSAKWRKTAMALASKCGLDEVKSRRAGWFAAFGRGRSVKTLGHYIGDSQGAADSPNDGNADVMKGLIWLSADLTDAETPRQVSQLLLACVRKVPGVGPRSPKVASACIWVLGELAGGKDEALRDGALAQLARAKARVTYRPTLKAIDKALDKAAERAGMSREDLDELAVPTFGFEDGERIEAIGVTTATLHVAGDKIITAWTNEKGRAVKSPPAVVKREFKEEIKELKRATDDAAGVLQAARHRLDGLYLLDKSWPIKAWRERYLDHPLVGSLARRLIWSFEADGKRKAVAWVGDELVDASDQPFDPADDAMVRLWHPIDAEVSEVEAWRTWLDRHRVTQPFKQAHREVYLLTAAERNTRIYSNRFAGHVLKQHQFSALCAARNWRHALQLGYDGASGDPATRELPTWNLRVEYWVDGAGDDVAGSGAFLYLTTDQVRFYETGEREPLLLDRVPPIVFSEGMRDVDLFVGVASVGNDPTWQDTGTAGQRNYWADYSFGDLSQTAQTRKAVLETLVPRLRIADRCSFTDTFLVVRGDLRTYKIHLGSGNILMEPNDQYLCIVPDRRADKAGDAVFLPFEGDRTLSVVLSKALLLAADTKIKDPTIVSQISR